MKSVLSKLEPTMLALFVGFIVIAIYLQMLRYKVEFVVRGKYVECEL